MKITLKNLGPIKEATIDLAKKFTILCGMNSTGKTYAAYVIYYLLRYVPGRVISRFRDVDKLPAERAFTISADDVEEWRNGVAVDVKRALPKIFGISPAEAEKSFAAFSMDVDLGQDPMDLFIRHFDRGQLAIGNHKILRWEKPQDSADIILTPLEDIDFIQKNADCGAIITTIISKIIRDSFLATDELARMLTVERNSIYTFKSELAVNRFRLVEQMQEGADESVVRRVGRYPKAVADSLKTAADLENITKRDSGFRSIAEILEADVLKGTVGIGEHGDVFFAPLGREEMPLRIQMASSMVKTLSALDIYLRHLAGKGEYLIMDEPEMNLHPELQRLLARVFARMVREGIRLIISTHSDYILREINSLVMAGSLREHGDTETAARFGITDELILRPEMLQPVLFTPGPDGSSTARNVETDGYGFHVDTIDETIERQNEMTLVLSETLDYYTAGK